MTGKSGAPELAALRREWQARRMRLREILRRFDHTGMTRPARDPEEREWIVSQGGQPFVEDDRYVEEARAYYARKYRR
jgi:hypothetical protein